MIGEIRDFETAEIGVKAALTGHLVLSHAAHQRRAGHGEPPAQHGHRALPGDRLAEPDSRPAALPQALPGLQEAQEGRRGAGADRRRRPARTRSASFTALREGRLPGLQRPRLQGRVAIYEVMPFWDGLKELVINGASAAELKQEAIRLGMQTLRMSALDKMMAGRHHPRRGGRQHRPRPVLTFERRATTPWPICISCSRRWSRRVPPTSTSPPARRRSCASTASWCRSRRRRSRRSRPSSSATRFSPTPRSTSSRRTTSSTCRSA